MIFMAKFLFIGVSQTEYYHGKSIFFRIFENMNRNLHCEVVLCSNPIITQKSTLKIHCRYDEDAPPDYSSVTAPYPPPPPDPRSANDDQDHLQPSQEALQRLAGAASKRRKVEEEGFNQIIDVNFDDIKPDEREWLTKALTEDDADRPGPKVRKICHFELFLMAIG